MTPSFELKLIDSVPNSYGELGQMDSGKTPTFLIESFATNGSAYERMNCLVNIDALSDFAQSLGKYPKQEEISFTSRDDFPRSAWFSVNLRPIGEVGLLKATLCLERQVALVGLHAKEFNNSIVKIDLVVEQNAVDTFAESLKALTDSKSEVDIATLTGRVGYNV